MAALLTKEKKRAQSKMIRELAKKTLANDKKWIKTKDGPLKYVTTNRECIGLIRNIFLDTMRKDILADEVRWRQEQDYVRDSEIARYEEEMRQITEGVMKAVDEEHKLGLETAKLEDKLHREVLHLQKVLTKEKDSMQALRRSVSEMAEELTSAATFRSADFY